MQNSWRPPIRVPRLKTDLTNRLRANNVPPISKVIDQSNSSIWGNRRNFFQGDNDKFAFLFTKMTTKLQAMQKSLRHDLLTATGI
jgi:hypothetical protein